MKENNIRVSIIIVNYKVKRELLNCVSSIVESKPKVKFEIIVVDNGSSNNLSENLNRFSQVKCTVSAGNIGFGAGNNLGVKKALGDYLFFLNPDTLVDKGAIDCLFNFIKDKPNTGMVAPLLYDPEGEVYPLQGSDAYTFVNAIIVLSFINKLFPNNSVSRKFFHKEWDKKDVEEFDVVPGTAFMIKKDLFEKIGKFDENFFLYFEEYDLAKRVKELGYKNYIAPKAKVKHIWEASTRKRNDINKIFSRSRYYFFKKNYGIVFALIIKVISSLGKYELTLGLILCISSFLSLFRIRELMVFIGDQGWFYLSARDMLTTGQIPLVGIASSHPWLHQGPFWTYFLALFLWLFNFDPVSGAYLTVVLGVLSVVGIYIAGSTLLSKRVGLIAALLYATSPLVIYSMRFPYHTSPIPLFITILTILLCKIIRGRLNYLPLVLLLLAVLHNFEIATVVLWGAPVGILTYIFFKKRSSLEQIFNKKIVFFSIIAIVTPLLPMILYDIRNGFPQTLKFIAWIIYRTASFFNNNSQQAFSVNKISEMTNFLFINFKRLIFAPSNLVSFIVFTFLIIGTIYMLAKKKSTEYYKLILTLICVPLIFITLNQTPSDAYLPIFFPTILLLFSLILEFVMRKKGMIFQIIILLMFLSIGNVLFMLKNNFTFDQSNKILTLNRRLQAANQILNITQQKDYNLNGKGPGSQFESFTMNYEYLTWWLGHGPSKTNEKLKIFISDSANGIKIEESNIDR